MPNQYSDEDREKIRSYHRDKALTRRAGRKSAYQTVAHLEVDVLWEFIQQRVKTVHAEAMDGRNFRLMTAAHELQAAVMELHMRGNQMQMDIPGATTSGGEEPS